MNKNKTHETFIEELSKYDTGSVASSGRQSTLVLSRNIAAAYKIMTFSTNLNIHNGSKALDVVLVPEPVLIQYSEDIYTKWYKNYYLKIKLINYKGRLSY